VEDVEPLFLLPNTSPNRCHTGVAPLPAIPECAAAPPPPPRQLKFSEPAATPFVDGFPSRPFSKLPTKCLSFFPPSPPPRFSFPPIWCYGPFLMPGKTLTNTPSLHDWFHRTPCFFFRGRTIPSPVASQPFLFSFLVSDLCSLFSPSSCYRL